MRKPIKFQVALLAAMVVFWVFIDYFYVKLGQVENSWPEKLESVFYLFPILSLVGGYFVSTKEKKIGKAIGAVVGALIFILLAFVLLVVFGTNFHLAIGGRL